MKLQMVRFVASDRGWRGGSRKTFKLNLASKLFQVAVPWILHPPC